jgi:tetratricopeptide (TPR) repeat protein
MDGESVRASGNSGAIGMFFHQDYCIPPKIKPIKKKTNAICKALLSLLTVVLAFSIKGCLPSFDPEAEEHFWQGIEYRRQEKNDLAMEEFTRAIELDPEYDLAYYNRALLYYFSGELERSLLEYNKALGLSPDNPYWRYERGFLYLELGEREKAIVDLERSLEIGLVGSDRQRVEEALSQLRQ